MAKGNKGQRRRITSRRCRWTPYSLLSCDHDISANLYPKKFISALEKEGWKDVTCSVCMECPHNAVLLLCSSHDNGCRPYMCGTSFRYSNCLDQYKNAYTKVSSNGTADNPILVSDSGSLAEKYEVTELACPLCRGQVKGWTVVEPAREYLNEKKRSCMQEGCLFVGTYKELRKHMRTEHPSARPREVDPALEQKWRRLEHEREHNDVISTIRSTMPGAMVYGDYVIERNHYGLDIEEDDLLDEDSAERNGGFGVGFDRNLVNVFLLLHAFGPSGDDVSGRLRQPGRANHQTTDEDPVGIGHTSVGRHHDDGNESNDDNGADGGMSLVSRLRSHGTVLLGRSGRRRRRREATNDGRT